MSKAVLRSIKNVTNGYTAAQVKVRNATSNDAWGPSSQDMHEIAQLTFQNHELFEVMDMIDRRLNDKGKNWRHVMKALTLLDYLIHCGSENVVLWSKDNLYVIKTLREFQYIDEAGRDQGANIRQKAKELTSLLLDDDRLRQERKNNNFGGSRRRRRNSRAESQRAGSPPANGRGNMRQNSSEADLQRALEVSRMTAEEEERRRRDGNVDDDDLRKALALSKEEEEQRSRNNLFDVNSSQPNLIDTSEPVYYQQQQQQQPQMAQMTGYVQQPQFAQPTQGYAQVDLFGNPLYQQQPMATGMLQNAYATGGGYPQQQQQFATGFQQQPQAQFQQPQQEPEPLQPLKTGSNNPFAKLNAQNNSQPAQSSQPSLNQMQMQQQQQQQQPQQLTPQRTNNNNFDQSHMNELNTLLANGDGIDTFGNVGELRIPAQHTKSTFVNSAGQTGGLYPQQTSNNPFMGAQYTGVATTNLTPAFTGYGFGNAQSSQQAYQQQQSKQNPNNLIDL